MSYNTIDGTIINRRDLADKTWKSEEHQKDISYMQNCFMELSDLFLRMQQKCYKYDMVDNLIVSEVVNSLQTHANYWEKDFKSSRMGFRYAVILPTHWDDEIREKLILPLFIQAGLINKNDHHNNLFFFTHLQSLFKGIQTEYRTNTKIEYGKQYLLCTLDFDGEIHVNLELVSAQFPFFNAIDQSCAPQSLKAVQLTVPFKLKDRRELIKVCLEKRCTTKLTAKLIDILTYESGKFLYPGGIERRYFTINPSIYRHYVLTGFA